MEPKRTIFHIPAKWKSTKKPLSKSVVRVGNRTSWRPSATGIDCLHFGCSFTFRPISSDFMLSALSSEVGKFFLAVWILTCAKIIVGKFRRSTNVSRRLAIHRTYKKLFQPCACCLFIPSLLSQSTPGHSLGRPSWPWQPTSTRRRPPTNKPPSSLPPSDHTTTLPTLSHRPIHK